MFIAVLSGFMLAALAPFLHRAARGQSGWICALLPAGLFVYFLSFLPVLSSGTVIAVSWPWVPALGVNLSFSLDGLSLLFSLLITGVGALILVYAGGYLKGHHHLGRFHAFLLLFMASMLGLVLADNVITLFVFWELTSLSSYFLIGFDHEREAARSAALQALLVTGLGGLALLAGFLLMGHAAGSFELSEILRRGDALRQSGHLFAILFLVLGGAFTKSAQFPFHFWLPSAMEAPTPVSAYLHSATMVKAGIYLLARLAPVFTGTAEWHGTLLIFGAVTMVSGAVLALGQQDLKRMLAYSTVSSLGTLTLLIGIGTQQAVAAAMVYLLAHALYKGSLFLVAGSIDHGAGTRDIRRLSGLARYMPLTAAAGIIAALSMAGVPPTLGYLGKELLYGSQLLSPLWPAAVTAASLVTNILLVAVAGIAGAAPFLGQRAVTPKQPHESPAAIVIGPLLLAAAGAFFLLVPGPLSGTLASASAAAMASAAPVDLSLWHGFNAALLLSVVTIAAGSAAYAGRSVFLRLRDRLRSASPAGPARWYDLALAGMLAAAREQTRLLQNGLLRHYLMIALGAVFLLVASLLVLRSGLLAGLPVFSGVRFYEWIAAGIILAAAFTAVSTRSRLTAVAAMGAVGYGVALVYTLFSAPDLAMTQFSIETLTVILFVLVLYRLPRFALISHPLARTRDVIVSLANGMLITLLVLAALNESFRSRVSDFFIDNALSQAGGRNTVNVIIVDFRGLDTLGEITVLAVAALGVFALLKTKYGGEEGAP